uniref:Galectin n=1 Tax=Biomphalaria glabrata TaxID=6526 RepID=A0A2C9KII4_BIOGL
MFPTCWTKTLLVLACLLLDQVQLSTPLSRFLFHQDLQMVGCSTKSYTGIIHLACAMKCLDTKKCPSFVYIPEKAYCKICTDGYTVTGLTFLPGSGTYLLRNVQEFNILLPSNNINLQWSFPEALLPSELLYLRAVLLGKGEWRINMMQTQTNIPFHFRRRSDGTCPSPCHTINTLANDNWGTELYVQDFPYVTSQSFELHILFRSYYALIYFNRRLMYTYNTNGRAVMEIGRYVSILGDFYVEELAI